jgi:DNA-directed RNA polymerase specialized sigma24 family protein
MTSGIHDSWFASVLGSETWKGKIRASIGRSLRRDVDTVDIQSASIFRLLKRDLIRMGLSRDEAKRLLYLESQREAIDRGRKRSSQNRIENELADIKSESIPHIDPIEYTVDETDSMILKMLGAGHTNAEVARRTGLSESAISSRIHRLKKKHKTGT